MPLTTLPGRQVYMIPDTLTHNSGIITAVINGITFTVAVGSPTGSTLYFLYLFNGTLQQSTTVPSTYRASNVGASLIGAYYSTGTVSPAWGSFVTIEGNPTSEYFAFTPTGTFTTNTTYTGFKKRVGDCFTYIMNAAFSGTPTLSGARFIMSSTESVDTAKMTSLQTYQSWGTTGSLASGSAWGAIEAGLEFTVPIGFSFWAMGASSALNHNYNSLSASVPTAYGNGDFIQLKANEIPIVGLTTRPLKDL